MTHNSKSVQTGRELVQVGSAQVGLLGRIGSGRGVQIVGIDGQLNQKVENHITTSLRFFSYLPRITAGSLLSVEHRSYQQARPLNFFAPGVSMAMKGGPATGVMCIFSATFMANLQDIERDFNFDKIDVLSAIDSRRLTYLGQEMLRETLSPGFGSALLAEAMGMAVALELTRCDGARQGEALLGGGMAPWQMRLLQDYVHENLANELTLPELANLLGISVRHLSRVVKQSKGMSVHRWVADLRMSEAQRLLSETNIPLHEIARRVAFKGAGAFSTAFRAASGFSPSDFRYLTRRMPKGAVEAEP